MSAVDPTLEMTDGFNLVVDALQMNGVETIYGVVGVPITDLARIAQAEGVRYVGFRQEQPAGHAAAAAGFLTQRPGICLTVSAPGFLNGVVALANATTNCGPMIQIAGSSDRAIVDLQQGDRVARSGVPGSIGKIGAVRSRAWIWDFSSTQSTTARSGGLRYTPTTSLTLATTCGSLESFHVS
jgi:glyoxylate carboligase